MGILYRYARTSAQAVECRVPVADRFTGRRGALVGRGAWSEGGGRGMVGVAGLGAGVAVAAPGLSRSRLLTCQGECMEADRSAGFDASRRCLHQVAYWVPGSFTGAEDAVQET